MDGDKVSARERVELRAFGAVVTILLSVIVWTGNRLVAQLDKVNDTVIEQGNALGRFDVRLGSVEKALDRMVGP